MFLVLACTADVDPEQLDAILALEGDPDAGDSLFVEDCEGCHGPGGDGSASAVALEGGDSEGTADALLAGPGVMPSFADESDQDLADLVAYVDEL